LKVTTESDTREPGRNLARLRRQWWLATGVYVLAAGLSYGLLRRAGLASPLWLWAMPVAGAMAIALAVLRRHLPDNHRRDEPAIFPDLGIANAVTLLRGALLGIFAGFLLLPQPAGGLAWLPVLVYTAAASTDFIDGYLARSTGRSTLLGERLDMEFDSLGALLAVSLAVAYDKLPAWALLMGLAHYLYVGGLAWRRWRGLPIHLPPSSIYGRVVAALFMSFVAVVLWPVLDPAATRFAVIWFALPLAASFGHDWLVATGRIDPASPAYRSALGRLHRLLIQRLPVLLRLVAATCFLALTAPALAAPGQPGASLAVACGAIGFVSVLLGLEARLGALLLLVPAGASISGSGLGWANGLLAASSILLLHTGSGALSLWRPSDRLFLQRLGRARPAPPQ
jgi:CDP-diacylglycerol--glycerol-3-phosphate 3-phosphatidyltransferase